jgi:putative FmdB family regulatory protein
MPVFEYKCNACHQKYEIYHKSSVSSEEIECPSCHSKDNKKLFSSFSASVSGDSFAYNDCASGNCNIAPAAGGCSTGMCGIN